MIKSKPKTIAVIVILVYVAVFLVFYFWNVPLDYLKDISKSGSVLSPLIFTILSFLAVIVAPVTILPLLPVASVVFGPFLAGTYILIGWVSGSITAFFIARRFGKPVLESLVSLKSLEKYEDKIPKEMEFWWVFLIRFVIQLDVLSYAFGLFSRVSFTKFSLATLLAFTPWAYIASFAGEAFFMRDFKNFAIILIISIAVFLVVVYFFYWEGGIKRKFHEEDNNS